MPGCGAGWRWRFEEDGSLSGTFRLPPLAGAVLLKALRAACADLAGDPRRRRFRGNARRRGTRRAADAAARRFCPGGPDVLGPG